MAEVNGGLYTRILLVASSESKEVENTVIGLADAALTRDHGVSVFFIDESVTLLSARRRDQRYVELLSRGARLLACRTHALISGVARLGGFLGGVESSSLGELVELMEDYDRVLFIGGRNLW